MSHALGRSQGLAACGLATALLLGSAACGGSTDPESAATPTSTAVTPAPTQATRPADAKPSWLQAEIPVGGAPGYLLSAFGSVWVGNHTGGSVSRIDPGRNRVVAEIAVRPEVVSLAAGAGSVWTFRTLARFAVVRIDPATNKVVATIPVDTAPGIKALAFSHGSLWLAAENRVWRIDPRQNKVVSHRRLGEPSCQSSIAAGFGALWHVCAGQLHRLDPVSGAVTAKRRIPADAQIVSTGAGAVWVPLASGRLLRVEPTTAVVEQRLEPKVIGLEQVFVDRTGLWLRSASTEVDRASVASGRIDYRYDELPAAPIPGGGILVAFGALWACNFGTDTVWRIDPKAA